MIVFEGPTWTLPRERLTLQPIVQAMVRFSSIRSLQHSGYGSRKSRRTARRNRPRALARPELSRRSRSVAPATKISFVPRGNQMSDPSRDATVPSMPPERNEYLSRFVSEGACRRPLSIGGASGGRRRARTDALSRRRLGTDLVVAYGRVRAGWRYDIRQR